MKNAILIFFLTLVSSIYCQERYLTRTGEIHFEASVPSFEPVASQNNSATVILNPSDGAIAALALIKAFRFENALMEEHFNENYAESYKYPKATLKGSIEGFSIEKLSEKSTQMMMNAQLTFHGVTKSLDIPVEISKKGRTILFHAEFSLKPEDFNIKVPGVVRNKVAKKVNVEVNFMLQKQ